jgi:hypothetical protein
MRLGVDVLRRPPGLSQADLVGQPTAWLRSSIPSGARWPVLSRTKQLEQSDPQWHPPRVAVLVPAVALLVTLALFAALILLALEFSIPSPVRAPRADPGLNLDPCGDVDSERPVRSERDATPARLGLAFTC